MTLDYNTLKQAAREGLRLGKWHGKSVFAAGTEQLDSLGSDAYYILYDDENRIVSRSSPNGGWKSYGTVSESGSINEYSSARNYKTPAEVLKAAWKTASKTSISEKKYNNKAEWAYVPGYQISERPIGDVKAEMDIEKVLEHAREMSVESLLDGFLANVSFEAKG